MNLRQTNILYVQHTIVYYLSFGYYCVFNPFTANPIKALHFAILV